MLSARAYSFRQKSRLAISLSWIAGFTNAVASIMCLTFVSHMSGNSTAIGRDLGLGRFGSFGFYSFIVLTFFLGAVVSALLMESARRRGLRSKYLFPLAVELFLLIAVMIALMYHGSMNPNHDLAADHAAPLYVAVGRALPLYLVTGLAALALGIQNATITSISGAVVRSTHVTGVVTDLGLEGVQLLLWYYDHMRGRTWRRAGRVLRLSQRHPTAQRVMLLACIWGSFVAGAGFGAVLESHYGPKCLILPIAALAYLIVQDIRKPIADIREIDSISDPELKLHGILHELLPPELGIYRLSHHRHDAQHRAPDFSRWVVRVPRQRRVLILAISPLTRLDPNAAMDLADAVEQLHEAHQQIILCGVNVKQYKVLSGAGVIDAIGSHNLCPDLEFAIAQAYSLIRADVTPAAVLPDHLVAS